MLAVLIEEVHRGTRRYEQQRAEFARALGLVVDALERIFPVVRDVAVEVVELLVADLFLRARPEGLHGVDGLLLLVILFLLFRVVQVDRIGHEVGIFLDDAAQRPLRKVVLCDIVLVVFFLLFFHVERDRASLRRPAAPVYRVGPVAGGFPLPALGAAGLERFHRNPVGGDKT
ncbi:hypothetical protein SDC9_153631 [bioreactor metagenome]|uniref:Uncharacterized protein n=1 Tax=bioreactor metagenome TaxID=1076179 RepID=A0A645EWH5_9ZZZZ